MEPYDLDDSANEPKVESVQVRTDSSLCASLTRVCIDVLSMLSSFGAQTGICEACYGSDIECSEQWDETNPRE